MKKHDAGAAKFVGMADPETTLNLLWGSAPESKRGRKPSLSARAVGMAALEMADEGGLAALSMRALGARLGVAAMAIYRYVPNKDVLLELLLEAAYAQLPDELPAGKNWQARLRTVALDAWDLYLAHPWMLQISLQRPSLGPHAIRKYERELKAIDAAGFSDLDMDLVIAAVADYVRGSARSAIEASDASSATGETHAEWWAAHQTHLARLVDPHQFPLAVRVGATAGAAYGGPTDPRRSFVFGLELFVNGVAAYLEAGKGRQRAATGA